MNENTRKPECICDSFHFGEFEPEERFLDAHLAHVPLRAAIAPPRGDTYLFEDFSLFALLSRS